MSLPFRGDLVRVRRNRAVVAALSLPVLLPLVFASVGGGSMHALLPFLPQFGVVGAVVAFLFWQSNPWARRDVVKVSADGTALEVDGVVYPREALRDGFVVPTGGETRIVLNRRGLAPALQFVANNVNEARRVLIGLGFDASQTVARFRTLSRVFSNMYYLVGLGFAFFVLFMSTGWMFRAHPATFFLPILTFLVASMLPSRLTVGADGVEVTWLGRKRFIRHRDIVNVTQYFAGAGNSRYTGVALWLESGEEVRIPVSQARRVGGNGDRTRMIIERITEAAEAGQSVGPELDVALLARGDRETDAWIVGLKSLGAGANATLRTAPIEIERIWRVLEDAGASSIARAAAATALTSDPAAESRRRLRAVAEATAEPKLRIAIDAAASHDDAALREALAELEAEEIAAREKA